MQELGSPRPLAWPGLLDLMVFVGMHTMVRGGITFNKLLLPTVLLRTHVHNLSQQPHKHMPLTMAGTSQLTLRTK